jgi:transposase-like protein
MKMKLNNCKLKKNTQLRQAKRVLRNYNGIHTDSFPWFLKECEFWFNYGTPKQQLGNVEAVV